MSSHQHLSSLGHHHCPPSPLKKGKLYSDEPDTQLIYPHYRPWYILACIHQHLLLLLLLLEWQLTSQLSLKKLQIQILIGEHIIRCYTCSFQLAWVDGETNQVRIDLSRKFQILYLQTLGFLRVTSDFALFHIHHFIWSEVNLEFTLEVGFRNVYICFDSFNFLE